MLLGVGAWSMCEFGAYEDLSPSVPYAAASKLVIAAGIFNVLVSFFGCWLASKENRRLFIIVSHLFRFVGVVIGEEGGGGKAGGLNLPLHVSSHHRHHHHHHHHHHQLIIIIIIIIIISSSTS